jgi:hypothetical protein
MFISKIVHWDVYEKLRMMYIQNKEKIYVGAKLPAKREDLCMHSSDILNSDICAILRGYT